MHISQILYEPAIRALRNTKLMNVTAASISAPTVEDCRMLVDSGMAKVDDLIRQRLSSEVVLINQLSGYIIGNGGKRLRPQLVLMSAGACGHPAEKLEGVGRHAITVAAIIEFIHTATLLHDDVVDASELRRGQKTANAVWGNEAAVLAQWARTSAMIWQKEKPRCRLFTRCATVPQPIVHS